MSSLALPPLPLGIPAGPPDRAPSLPGMPRPTELPSAQDRSRPPFREPLATESAPRAKPPRPRPAVVPLPQAGPGPQADYADRDLAEALRPLVGASTLPEPEAFETLVRATFRRTLAEHTSGPFDPPDLLRRAAWRLDSLFRSRSYEETVDEKMHRFRIEEIHLLDRSTLGPVSFASVNPARHADARKVRAASARIATLIAGLPPGGSHDLRYSRSLRVFVRPGEFALLAALVRGRPDPFVESDLDYALRRIESRFATPLADGTPLLQEIQPLLEECLLIHSPPSPLPR